MKLVRQLFSQLQLIAHAVDRGLNGEAIALTTGQKRQFHTQSRRLSLDGANAIERGAIAQAKVGSASSGQ